MLTNLAAVLFRRQPPAPAIHVFVSHSRDSDLAHQICTGIEEAGAAFFLDELRVEAGDVFEARILEGLRTCTEHVVLLSPRSIERPYVWMEIGAAWFMKRRIVGILNGVTIRELRARDGMPACILDLNLIDASDVAQFFAELGKRVSKQRGP